MLAAPVRTLTAVALGSLCALATPASSQEGTGWAKSKTASAAQIELCFEIGENSKDYYECEIRNYLKFVKACGIKPTVKIDDNVLPRMKQANAGSPIGNVDALLEPLVAYCDAVYNARARAVIRSKVKGVHVMLADKLPAPIEKGAVEGGGTYENYGPILRFTDGILEQALYWLPESTPTRTLTMAGDDPREWVVAQVLGDAQAYPESLDKAAAAQQEAEEGRPQPKPAPISPEQRQRVKRLLTEKLPDAAASTCIESGRACMQGGKKCCSGTCPRAGRNSFAIMKCN